MTTLHEETEFLHYTRDWFVECDAGITDCFSGKRLKESIISSLSHNENAEKIAIAICIQVCAKIEQRFKDSILKKIKLTDLTDIVAKTLFEFDEYDAGKKYILEHFSHLPHTE